MVSKKSLQVRKKSFHPTASISLASYITEKQESFHLLECHNSKPDEHAHFALSQDTKNGVESEDLPNHFLALSALQSPLLCMKDQ